MSFYPKFDENQATAILKAIREGLHPEAACARAGIPTETLAFWLHRGRNRVKPFTDFRREFDEAEAQLEAQCLAQVLGRPEEPKAPVDPPPEESNPPPPEESNPPSPEVGAWRAFVWYLERRFPARWGRNTHQHSQEESPHDHDATVNEFIRRLDGIAERQRTPQIIEDPVAGSDDKPAA